MFPKCDRFLDNKYTYPVLLALVFGVSIGIHLVSPPCVDDAWFVLMARRMLDGVILYKDFWEPNLPLIAWIYTIPVIFADILSIAPVVCVKLFTVFLIALSLAICGYILRHSSFWAENGRRRSFLLAMAAILLLSADSYVVFAQREHLLIVFILPYLLLNLPSVRQQALSPWLRGALGGMAAFGFCLKPHFFIIWLALLAYKMAKTRSLRVLFGPAEMAIGFAILFYVACIAVFTPYYFSYIRVVAQFYNDMGLMGPTTPGIIFELVASAAVAALFSWVFGLFRIEAGVPYKQDVTYLLWIAAGAYVEMLVQFKSWVYVHYPFMALGMLPVITVILLRPYATLYALIAMGWLFQPTPPFNGERMSKGYTDIMQKAIMPYEHSKDLYYIGLYLGLSYPCPQLLRPDAPLVWAGKFNRIFELEAIMELSPATGLPTLTVRPGKEWIEHWLLGNIADDLEKKQPDLLIIDKRWDAGEPLSEGFDMFEWLKKEPRITLFLRGYTLRKEVELCSALESPDNTRRCGVRVFTRNNP